MPSTEIAVRPLTQTESHAIAGGSAAPLNSLTSPGGPLGAPSGTDHDVGDQCHHVPTQTLRQMLIARRI